MAVMADKVQARLGTVQQTLFIPLAGRARQTRRKRPVLRDPKAVEIVESVDFDTAKYGRDWGGAVTVLRTAIFDWWVRAFLAEHPAGTVVEIGTGLNTRFERVDNGRVHWIDLDLPDTIELRRKFFADSARRRMVAASVLDDDWMPAAADSPGPCFFVADGVLTYLAQAPQVIARIAERFPGSLIAFDTYDRKMLERQHRMAAKRAWRPAGRGPATTRARWSRSGSTWCRRPRSPGRPAGSAGSARSCCGGTGTCCPWPAGSWATWPQ
jgi:O-methyltransferase involved in polyketide biosynthesis